MASPKVTASDKVLFQTVGVGAGAVGACDLFVYNLGWAGSLIAGVVVAAALYPALLRQRADATIVDHLPKK